MDNICLVEHRSFSTLEGGAAIEVVEASDQIRTLRESQSLSVQGDWAMKER